MNQIRVALVFIGIFTTVIHAFSVYRFRHSLRCKMYDRKLFSASQKSTIGRILDIDSVEIIGSKVKSLGMPRVLGGGDGNSWKMWFQYRDESIAENVMDISSGRIGLLTSLNGIDDWVVDPSTPVLRPSKENGDWFYFDSQHVGLGDIIQPGSNLQSRFNVDSNVYLMYTYGGNSDAINLEESQRKVIGSKMEIGVAVSMDGINWSKVEGPGAFSSILEVGTESDFDAMFVGWPTVLEVNGYYRMYYHTYNPTVKKYMIATAVSKDGLKWTKEGPVFQGASADTQESFDGKGANRRHIIRSPNNDYRMFYEAVSKNGVHSIGLAISRDGLKWERCGEEPVFSRNLDPNSWDHEGVGSPNVVYIPETKRWRLYYVGHTTDSSNSRTYGIGVAESVDEVGLEFKRLNITPKIQTN